MRKINLLLLICIFLSLGGCLSQKTSNSSYSSSPDETIKSYFIAYNDKNLLKLKPLLSERLSNSGYDFNNIEYIKLLKTEEAKDFAIPQDYMAKGKEKDFKPEAIKVFSVEYEIKYKDISRAINPSEGKDTKYFYLVKRTKESPWVIDSIGY